MTQQPGISVHVALVALVVAGLASSIPYTAQAERKGDIPLDGPLGPNGSLDPAGDRPEPADPGLPFPGRPGPGGSDSGGKLTECKNGASASFTATPASIPEGGASTLRWHVRIPPGCESLKIFIGDRRVDPVGSDAVSPRRTRVYSLYAGLVEPGLSADNLPLEGLEPKLLELVQVLVDFRPAGSAAGGADAWRQFHGAGSSAGLAYRATRAAVQPKWTLDIGEESLSSPVVGPEGVIYLGSTGGSVVAVNPDGSLRRRYSLQGSIPAAPALAEDGSIYVIRNVERPAPYYAQSSLVKLSPDGAIAWSYQFPVHGYTEGAPRVWDSPDGAYIFVYIMRSFEGRPATELFVFDSQGRVRARSGALTCQWPEEPNIFEILWEVWTTFPLEFDPRGAVPHSQGAYIAVTDVFPENGEVLAAIADDLCHVGVYRFDGADLQRQFSWGHDLQVGTSAPMLLRSGLLVVGNSRGQVRGFSVVTGALLWVYDAGQPVRFSPAGFTTPIFVISNGDPGGRLHVLTSEGDLITRRGVVNRDGPCAAPAISREFAYVPRGGALVSHDLDYLFSDSGFVGQDGRSYDHSYAGGSICGSPAIGPEGTIYVIHDDSELWAYPAP